MGTDAAGIPSAKAGSSSGSTARKVQQDAASRKWLDGLRLVYARLAALQAYGSGSRRNPGLVGHTGVLRQLALVQCIRRLDALLFYYLVKTDGKPQRQPCRKLTLEEQATVCEDTAACVSEC